MQVDKDEQVESFLVDMGNVIQLVASLEHVEDEEEDHTLEHGTQVDGQLVNVEEEDDEEEEEDEVEEEEEVEEEGK